MQVVENIVQSPDFPPTETSHEYALHTLLTSSITHQLGILRTNQGLPAAGDETSVKELLEAVQADVASAHMQLLAWSTLYHRFVQTLTDVKVDVLARLYGMDERTLRRYISLGEKLLTRHLVGLEQEARLKERRIRLINALPTRGKTKLYGRDDVLSGLHTFVRTDAAAHVLLTGLSGLGKSTLAERLVLEIVEHDPNIERVIWIPHCASVEYVRHDVVARMQVDDGNMDIRRTLAVYKTIIVLDDASSLLKDVDAFNSLLSDLADALVVIITEEFTGMLRTVGYHMRLQPIDEEAALQITQDVFRARGVTDLDLTTGIAQDLYRAFGGHPLALRIAAARWDDLDWSSLEDDVIRHILTRTFDRQDSQSKRIWCALGLLGKHEGCLSMLTTIWGTMAGTGSISVLASQMLVQRIHHDCYILLDAAQLFISRGYRSHSVVRQIVDELIAAYFDNESALAFPDMLVRLTTSSWSLPAYPVLENWLIRCWHNQQQSGLNAAEWIASIDALRRMNHDIDVRLEIAYAASLRRLSELDHSAVMLLNTVQRCGREGDFQEQARALVELALTYILQGNLVAAHDLLNRAAQSRLAQQDLIFRRRIDLILAQVAIEQRDGPRALSLLRHLNGDPIVYVLLAEASLLIGDIRMAARLAEQVLAEAPGDLPLRVRVCTVIGRCREQLSSLDTASRYFAEALLCAQRIGDHFGIARAKSNLGAVLVKRGKYVEANELLSHAVAIQSTLGDSIGLQISQHNRIMFERRVAG
ncbi:MAG: tetratricopeptide repeat protein [Chloroflexi bacterium]|nr:tetratricopeptide repeat protein [Chloroflexota bacterium]